jgi:hypothetical protein
MTRRTIRITLLIAGVLAVFAALASVAASAPSGAAAPVPALKGTPGPGDFPGYKDITEGPANQPPAAMTPCVGGFAGIYPCNGIDLMSNVPLNGFPGARRRREGHATSTTGASTDHRPAQQHRRSQHHDPKTRSSSAW